MSVMNDIRYSSVYTSSTRIELRLVPSMSNPCLWYRADRPRVGSVHHELEPLDSRSGSP